MMLGLSVNKLTTASNLLTCFVFLIIYNYYGIPNLQTLVSLPVHFLFMLGDGGEKRVWWLFCSTDSQILGVVNRR